MAFYTIVPQAGGKFGVEIDEGGEKPIILGPFDTELAAQAAIDEQKRMAAEGASGQADATAAIGDRQKRGDGSIRPPTWRRWR